MLTYYILRRITPVPKHRRFEFVLSKDDGAADIEEVRMYMYAYVGMVCMYVYVYMYLCVYVMCVLLDI